MYGSEINQNKYPLTCSAILLFRLGGLEGVCLLDPF